MIFAFVASAECKNASVYFWTTSLRCLPPCVYYHLQSPDVSEFLIISSIFIGNTGKKETGQLLVLLKQPANQCSRFDQNKPKGVELGVVAGCLSQKEH